MRKPDVGVLVRLVGRLGPPPSEVLVAHGRTPRVLAGRYGSELPVERVRVTSIAVYALNIPSVGCGRWFALAYLSDRGGKSNSRQAGRRPTLYLH